MRIVTKYGKNVIYGFGCGSVEESGTLCTFILVSLPLSPLGARKVCLPSSPFKTPSTLAGLPRKMSPGLWSCFRIPGNGPNNPSGQRPGISTRRYSHRMIATLNGKYVHVFGSCTNKDRFAYSLRTNYVCEAFLVEGYYPFWDKNDPGVTKSIETALAAIQIA